MINSLNPDGLHIYLLLMTNHHAPGRAEHRHQLRPHLMGGEPSWAHLPFHVQFTVTDHHRGDGLAAARHQDLRWRVSEPAPFHFRPDATVL